MFSEELITAFGQQQTPFYYYDVDLLRQTLDSVTSEANSHNFHVHYAMKANSNDKILDIIRSYGLGADCVSGNEVLKAIEMGFTSDQIVFAGVGKSDEEINLALDHDIFCFNCESIQELEVINELAELKGKTAKVALRINPNVDANTHKYITTGLEENKFGINMWEMEEVLDTLQQSKNIRLVGLHFHIGSQITDLTPFRNLCLRVNEIQQWFLDRRMRVEHINVGGGLGIDYHNPDQNNIADFGSFFNLFARFLALRPGQQLHFELGRSLVGHCGNLISKVLYIKNGVKTNFAILDAGMTELIRPALYQSYHTIQNLTGSGEEQYYDVVGPICESSDCFGKKVKLPETKRGDFMAIRSAGAYGEIMASGYNLRNRAVACYSDELHEPVLV
jgi:diaminopimelate decarboxylase